MTDSGQKRSLDLMLINIKKLSEDDSTVEYDFSTTVEVPHPKYRYGTESVGRNHGTILLDKRTGQTVLAEPMPEDENQACFIRAARKIRKHWEAGEYPDETRYASG